VERAEQDFEMVRVLVMVVMDALPGAGEGAVAPHPAAVQDVAVDEVPEERVSERGGADRGQRRRERGRLPDPRRDRDRAERQIGDDRRILEIGDDQFLQRHLVEMMLAPPESGARGRLGRALCGLHVSGSRLFL